MKNTVQVQLFSQCLNLKKKRANKVHPKERHLTNKVHPKKKHIQKSKESGDKLVLPSFCQNTNYKVREAEISRPRSLEYRVTLPLTNAQYGCIMYVVIDRFIPNTIKHSILTTTLSVCEDGKHECLPICAHTNNCRKIKMAICNHQTLYWPLP